MLFFLDDSIQADFEDPSLCDAIENLALTHREGKHILSSSRGVINGILENLTLSERTKSVLISIRNELPQYGKFNEALKRYILIVSKTEVNRSIERDNQFVLKISYDKFRDSATIQKTILLAEDIKDADFYKIVGKVYAYENNFRGVMLTAQTRGGGGSAIYTEYSRIQEDEERLCLCISDSDLEGPPCFFLKGRYS